MSALPDELWRRILEIGIETPNSSLTYKDLCCLSIACRRLNRLSNDESLWSSLLSSDFPQSQSPTTQQQHSSSSSSQSSSPNSLSKSLYRIRQASAALNVWQPEIIRGRHKQIVEQCVVPADSRIHALEMEVRLCKQQIAGLDKTCRDERKRLDAAKEHLGSIKYHPLRDCTLTGGRVDECGIKRGKG